jgi:hypothetical protein
MGANNTLETILKYTTENEEALEQMSDGLTNVEKAMAGTRTTIGGLNTDFTIFGKNIGSGADLLSGLGISIPTTPMQLFGQAIKAASDYLQSAVNDTVAYAEQVREMSRIIGASATETSTLIQVADDVKISYETLSGAMKIAIRNGVEPSIQGMADLADEYLSIQNPIERSRFLMENFGRAGADLGPLMELGSEGIRELGAAAQDTGLILDEEAIAATREYEIALDNLTDSADGLKTKIGLELVPALTLDMQNLQMLMDITGQLTAKVNGLSVEQKQQIQNFANMGGPVTALVAELIIAEEETVDLTEAVTDFNLSMSSEKDAIKAAKDAAIEYHEAAVEMNTIHGNIIVDGSQLIENFDAEAMALDLVRQGIDAYNLSAVESARLTLDIAFAMGELTEEEYKEHQAALDRIGNIEILNDLVAEGKLAEEDYIQALADGQVTRQEVLGYLWDAGYNLLEIQRIMGELDGSIADIGVNVDVTGPGAGLIGDPNWEPGQVLDPGEVGATSAPGFGIGMEERGAGERSVGGSSTENNYYTLNIYTSAPVEDIAGQFELLMRISEGG